MRLKKIQNKIMKKILVLALVILSVGSIATAQTGSVLLYGRAGVSSTKNNATDVKTSQIIFNPGIGYQFNANWAVGAEVGVESAKSESTTGAVTTTIKEPAFAVGPFLRYTKSLSSLFNVYGQLNLNYLSGKTTTEINTPSSSNTSRWNGFGAKFTPALSINVNNGCALTFDVGGIEYRTRKGTASGSKSYNEFDLNFGRAISIGLLKNFGK